jgi:hypothetical protein
MLGAMLCSRFFYRPVFLVGAGRSGTVALFRALGAHPQVLSIPGGEIPILMSIGRVAYLLEHGEQKEYFLEQTKVPKQYFYSKLKRICFESSTGPYYGYRTLIKSIMKSPSGYLGKRYWCVKTFPGQEAALGLLSLYPQAKFVYLVRSGINVVHSRTKFQHFRDREFAEHCQSWSSAAERFEYLQNFEAAVLVQQEELVDVPERVIQKICAHLAISSDDGPSSYLKNTLVHSLSDEETRESVDVKKIMDSRAPVYETWTKEQQNIFKDICGKTMEKLKYEIPF